MTAGGVHFLSAPTGSTCWDLLIRGTVVSQNATGLRGIIVANTTSGGSVYSEADFYGYEQVAIPVTTLEQKTTVLRFTVQTGSNVYYNLSLQGTGSTAAYAPIGYCD